MDTLFGAPIFEPFHQVITILLDYYYQRWKVLQLPDYAELFINKMLNSEEYKLSVKILDNKTKTVV